MPPTRKPSVVTDYGYNLLVQNKRQLGLNAVHYGDLEIIGAVPAVCIEPARLRREYEGGPFQIKSEFTIALIVYFTGTQGVEGNQRKADQVTEDVISLLDKEALPVQDGGTRWGDLLYEGMVMAAEYDYRLLSDKTMRANRIIFVGHSKTGLLEG